MKKIILIGGGGHCRSCIDVIEQEGKYQIVGILDRPEKIGTEVLGYKIIGSDDNVKSFVSNENHFLITIGQIKTCELRKNIYEYLKKENAQLATVISPRAHVSKYARVQEGTIILHDVLVNSCAEIGVNCIINTKALVEHDAVVGNHCHVSTASVVNGSCKLGDGVFVGSNAVLVHSITVPDNEIIPAGSFYRGKEERD